MRSTQALLPGTSFERDRLLAPQQALSVYHAAFTLPTPSSETVPIGAAYGRVLAADAIAPAHVPADARSTMDGFALRAADGRQIRRIVGEVRMGHAPPRAIGPGEAMRIPTGGVLPGGADVVVPIEDAVVEGDRLTPRDAPAAGDYFTPVGADIVAGACVLRAGRRIAGPELGVLATLGQARVRVYRRPRVAIVSTGDELVETGAQPGPGEIRDSNRWAIAGGLTAMGADVLHLPNARDDLQVLRAALASALAAADAVFLTGGSSVGERDLTPQAIDGLGEPGVIVHGLRVKPGKPTVLAAVGAVPVIGLPGNPTSALMILEALGAPIVGALTGERAHRPATSRMRAGAAIEGRPGWTWFVPVELRFDGDEERAIPLALRSSFVSLLARASGYVVVSEDRPAIAPGEFVDVVHFAGSRR